MGRHKYALLAALVLILLLTACAPIIQKDAPIRPTQADKDLLFMFKESQVAASPSAGAQATASIYNDGRLNGAITLALRQCKKEENADDQQGFVIMAEPQYVQFDRELSYSVNITVSQEIPAGQYVCDVYAQSDAGFSVDAGIVVNVKQQAD